MRTVGVDLTNFISPEPTWTKVAKGYRSTTRRTRKLVGKNTITTEVASKNNSAQEAKVVSEPEKPCAAVHGRHCALKEEHVPIKKRRYLFHFSSPSTSKIPSSPVCETQDQSVEINHAAKPSIRRSASVVDGNVLEVSDEVRRCNEHDRLSIEILGDVARNSQMCDDILPAKQNKLVEEPTKHKNPSTVSGPGESKSSVPGNSVVPQIGTVQEGGAGSAATRYHWVKQDIAPWNNPVTVLNNPSSYEHNGSSMEVRTGEVASSKNCVALIDKAFADKCDRQAGAGNTKRINYHKSPALVSDSSSAKECKGNPQLHWDLNLRVEAWEGLHHVGDYASQRNVGESSKDVQSNEPCGESSKDVHTNETVTPTVNRSFLMSSKSDSDGQTARGFQSGNGFQIEAGMLREANLLDQSHGDAGETEPIGYESEPEDEIIDSLCENVVNKMENGDNGSVSDLVSGSRSSEPFSSVGKHAVFSTDNFHMKGLSKGVLLQADKREFTSRDGMQRRRFDVQDHYNYIYAEPVISTGMDRSGIDARGRNPGNCRFGYWDKDSIVRSNASYSLGRSRPITLSRTNGDIKSNNIFHGSPRNLFKCYPENLNRGLRGINSSVPKDPNQYLGDISRRHMTNRGEMSNSPIIGKHDYSQSRSRSRYPTIWRHENISPNVRIEREEVSFHQRFPSKDYELGSGSRGSLLDTRRWYHQPSNGASTMNDDMGIINNRFNGRMVFCPYKRFDCMRRVNPETHFDKPMVHHRRFFNGGNVEE